MTKVQTLLTLIFAIGILSCARKLISCDMKPIGTPRLSLDSKVIRFERMAIADTTVAFISGTILGKDILEGTDTLIFLRIYAIEKKTGKIFSSVTDFKGHYQFYLPSSKYDLRVQYVGYNALIIKNALFRTGDIVKFDAILGEFEGAQDSSVFQMKRDGTIIEIHQPLKTNH